jgi:PleD family two-component response regulator
MIVLVKATVLTVGLEGKNKALKPLPIRVVNMRTGLEASRSLKNEKFDSIISNWELPDMKDGLFLKGLRRIKPDIPTIAVVKASNTRQEISARSIGVSAVLTSDTTDEMFRQTVAEILGLRDADSIKEISAVAEEIEER